MEYGVENAKAWKYVIAYHILGHYLPRLPKIGICHKLLPNNRSPEVMNGERLSCPQRDIH